jgi:hypothetical protein
MKNLPVGLVALIVFFVLVSCNNPESGGPEQKEILPKEGAYVRIPLPSFKSSRSVSLNEAKQLTDFYQVTFKRTDTGTPEYFSASAPSSNEYIELRIPVGQYDILLFAGNKAIVSPASPLLLASAYKQDQAILLEGTNIINLNVKLVEFDIDVPSLIQAGDAFEVEVHINFHNPFINYSNGTIGINYFAFVGGDSTREDVTVENPSYDPSTSNYVFATSFIAGIDNGDGHLYFHGSYIKPFGYGGESNEWSITNTTNNEFGGHFRTFLNFKVPEANINILWREE